MNIFSLFRPKPKPEPKLSGNEIFVKGHVRSKAFAKERAEMTARLEAELRRPMPIDPEFERIVKLQPEKPRVRVKAKSRITCDLEEAIDEALAVDPTFMSHGGLT